VNGSVVLFRARKGARVKPTRERGLRRKTRGRLRENCNAGRPEARRKGASIGGMAASLREGGRRWLDGWQWRARALSYMVVATVQCSGGGLVTSLVG